MRKVFFWTHLAFGLGPSYATEPRRFREEFGSDDELLAFQNQAITYAEAA